MNVAALVDRGLAIRAELKRLKLELDDIEDSLVRAGLHSEQKELKDADREGRRWLASGSELVVPVIFTADKIIGSFKMNSAIHSTVKTVSGNFLKDFYELTQTFENKFKDGKQFRSEADRLLGPRAATFVSACLARDKFGVPKSDVKIGWEDSMDKETAA